MKKNLRILSALGLLSAAAAAATAADAPAAAPAGPSLGKVLEASGITATGYVSGSYNHLSTDFGLFHQFDTNHHTFSLDQAALSVAYQPKEGFGALVNVIAGQDAKAINFAEDGSTNSFNVTQAFVQYAGGPVTVIAGKFVTLAGAEVIAVTGNTNYSRSLLFTNLEPLTHTGIRMTVAPSEVVSFNLGVNNGWNVTSDSNTQKTIEANVTVNPSMALSFALTGYFGNESSSSTGPGARNLIDFVGTWKVTDAFTLLFNYDNVQVKDSPIGGGRTDTVKSSGFALYGNLAFNDQWRASLRLEQIKDDSNGGFVTTIGDEKVKEATLTLGFAPDKNSEIRFEFRQDMGSGNTVRVGTTNVDLGKIFPDGPTLTDKQTEFALQALYKF
ncbi:MAG TPA: outer membrane beta-barrel protein [Steroidobacteraceae bacterium]|nr:outer membrane beta-barrel protein [Steroidobacteraceae bacterium]